MQTHNKSRGQNGVRTIVITHAGCGDGAAAGAAFTKAAYDWAAAQRTAGRQTTADYDPNLLPDVDPDNLQIHSTDERVFDADKRMPDITGCIVIIVDYCYPETTLNKLRSVAKYVRVFDHHPSRMNSLPEWMFVDQSRCAARIVWSKLHGVEPWFIPHIEDRDLWLLDRNKFSRQFSEKFYNDGLRVGTVIKYLDYGEIEQLNHYSEGAVLMKASERNIDRICSTAVYATFNVKGRLYNVIAVNSTQGISDVGNRLMSGIRYRNGTGPVPDFVVIYRYDIATSQWFASLRGEGDRFNLTEICREFGGGGHANAAGFSYSGDFTKLLEYRRCSPPSSPSRSFA